MTLLLDAEARLFVFPEETRAVPAPTHPRERARPREQHRTLEDLLSDTWEGLAAAPVSAACPVCDGELVPRWSAGAGVVGGRCRDCGSELS